MKKAILLITSVLFAASAAASSSVLTCARDIVENKNLLEKNLIHAAKIIDDSIVQKKEFSYKDCVNFKINEMPQTGITDAKFELLIDAFKVSNQAKQILKSLKSPYYECKFRSIEPGIAKEFGLKQNIGAAKCVGTNDRTYILLIPKSSFNMNFITKIFSNGSRIRANTGHIKLSIAAADKAIANFLKGTFATDLELNEIGVRSQDLHQKNINNNPRFRAIPL